MNFPLFYWNIARIPVATTFLFWWCATLIKFGWEVAPQRFLFEWKSVSEKFGREVAPLRFHFQSKSVSHAESAPLDFFFWTDFRFLRYRRGGRSCHVLCHVLFCPIKGKSMQAKTRAKREQNVRNMRVFPPANYTAPAPSSPSFMEMRFYGDMEMGWDEMEMEIGWDCGDQVIFYSIQSMAPPVSLELLEQMVVLKWELNMNCVLSALETITLLAIPKTKWIQFLSLSFQRPALSSSSHPLCRVVIDLYFW